MKSHYVLNDTNNPGDPVERLTLLEFGSSAAVVGVCDGCTSIIEIPTAGRNVGLANNCAIYPKIQGKQNGFTE